MEYIRHAKKAKARANGQIKVQIESRFLSPGSELDGMISVMLQEALPPCTLIFQVKGIEITYWKEDRTDRNTDINGSTTTTTHTEHFYGKRIIINFKYPLYQWNSFVSPGSFSLPFSFKLPDALPSTLKYSLGRTSASIQYIIKSKFILPMDRQLMDKVEIFIYEKIQEQKTNIHLAKSISLENTCCCCCCGDNGTLYMTSLFNQNSCTPDQVFSALVEADNTNGKINIKRLNCTLWRTIRLRDRIGRIHFQKNFIVACSCKGPGKGEKLCGSSAILFYLDLSLARNKIDTIYSAKGQLIECMYSICIDAVLDECCPSGLGRSYPSIEIPVIICAMHALPTEILAEPFPDWHPMIFEEARIEYNQVYDSRTE